MAEIQEYWIVDLSTRQVIIFRSPRDGKYIEQSTLATGTVTPVAFSELTYSHH